MSKDSFDKFFESTKTPEVNPDVKRRHIQAALKEFKRNSKQLGNSANSDQGNLDSLRPTVTHIQNRKENSMKKLKYSWLYGAFGSAAVVLLAVFVFMDRGLNTGFQDEDLPALVTENTNDLNDRDSHDNSRSDTSDLSRVKLTVEDSLNKSKPVQVEKAQVVHEALAETTIRSEAQSSVKASVSSTQKPLVKSVPKSQKNLKQEIAAVNARPSLAQAPSKNNKGQAFDAARTNLREKKLNAYAQGGAIVLPAPVLKPDSSRDSFSNEEINSIKLVKDEPVSTFSIDVDTASYSYVRRQLNNGKLPQKNAVRIEEMMNYFDYKYPLPKNKELPFESTIVVQDAPWNKGKKLMHVGIKGYELSDVKQPDSNLIFLLDVSGSMRSQDRLPLVKQAMQLLLTQLKPSDTVGIVVYAGAAGVVLEPTQVKDKIKILQAMDKLQAGGSTAGSQGINLAYELAERHFDKNAVNRIFLATDGDFNVGIRDQNQLKSLIESKRDKGIYLSILGFGAGNYQDRLMQSLAQNGNGVAAYIDTLGEAQKVLVHEATSTLFPIAKDVKIQVEFNPRKVSEYRLIGYETRALKREDFNNDKVDAGDIGSGHSVTAIYEFTPVGSDAILIDDLRYGPDASDSTINRAITQQTISQNEELAFLKIRYKLPEEKRSRLIEKKIVDNGVIGSELFNKTEQSQLIREVNFANAVAGFSQLLKDDKYLTDWSFDQSLSLAQENKGEDEYGYRTEFVQLVRKAMIAKEL